MSIFAKINVPFVNLFLKLFYIYLIKAYNYIGDDMCKRLALIEIILTSVFGTLLHFVYDWTGQNRIVGYFSAVNESTWEHLKLLFWPVTIISLVEFFILKDKKHNFLFARFLGLLCGILTIVTLFYTVTGIVGKSVDVFNISLYYFAVLVTFFVSRIIIKNDMFNKQVYNKTAFLLFGLLAAAFLGFTYNPPKLGIFKDPLS